MISTRYQRVFIRKEPIKFQNLLLLSTSLPYHYYSYYFIYIYIYILGEELVVETVYHVKGVWDANSR